MCKVTAVSVPKIAAGCRRQDYLHRLGIQKEPLASPAPKHQTVIIFDWDDTLLCTKFLTRLARGSSASVDAQLRSIEAHARQLLETALRVGHTFIITNAQSGWVEESATQWLPGLVPLLEKVPVISAQSRYGKCYPNDVAQWKVQTFLDVRKQFDSEVLTNLVALGDSKWEMEAARVLGGEFTEAFVKTIKFQEGPSAADLVKQLGLVASKFEQIITNARDMKISLERRSAVPAS